MREWMRSFWPEPQTRAEVEAVHAEVNIPLLLGGAGGELADREFLAANGVRVALQGHLPFYAAVKATYDTLKALRDGVSPGDLRDGQPSPALVDQVTRKQDYDRWTQEVLGVTSVRIFKPESSNPCGFNLSI